ncbi:MAG: hypothetical protein AB7P37_14445 [Ramlibacter sp.]
MLKKFLIPLGLVLTALAAQAQPTPAKQELIARILKLQQPGIEAMARGLAEQPAAIILDGMSGALSNRVAPEKREAIAREVQAEVRKYTDEAVPLVRDRAVKLAPSTIGAVLDEKFSEDELRQLVALIESPVYGKFQALGNDMQRALTQKLIAETRPQIEPKVKALEQGIARRLGITNAPAAPPRRPPASAPTK